MNWGKGIFITIIAFIAFIMYFVIKMNTDSKYDHDLVTEKYYEKELRFQKDIDASKNALELSEAVNITQTNEGLIIKFPSVLNVNQIKGNVFLYRPSNKQLDFEIPILLSDTNLLVPDKSLVGGRWNIKIDFTYYKKRYLFSKEIIY